jgi:hypothetical protein
MRIIGKYKDFYDSCLGYGRDENLTYVRDQRIFTPDSAIGDRVWGFKCDERKNFTMSYPAPWDDHHWPATEIKAKKFEYKVRPGLIGFCGMIYPYIAVAEKNYPGYAERYRENFFYDHAVFTEFMKQLKILPKGYFDKPEARKYWAYNRFCDAGVKNFFERVEEIDIFFDLGDPSFAITVHDYKTVVQTNPILKDFQFGRVFDAFGCFQELSMFLGGVLGEAHPPTVEISDEEMAKKKGFGHKYAFKKEPESMRNK